MTARRLHRTLTTLEFFTFGFGTMIGVGWLLLMDDWLGRGGPAGAVLGFLLGGVLLSPIARTYGRLVLHIQDAGAEIAYTRGVVPPLVSFACGWMMVLAHAIVCPWEAVALGNLLSRLWPAMNSVPLYVVAGRTIYLPRLAAGLTLIAAIALINHLGSRQSGRFQNMTTFGLLAVFLLLCVLGLGHGQAVNLSPPFSGSGAFISVLLILQIVPYYMSGFEAVAKGSEEARPGYDPRGFARAMDLTLGTGTAFYVLIVTATALLLPWQQIVRGHVGTEQVFQRAFSSPLLGRVIIVGAILSLLKVFNGTFLAASRLLFAIGRQGLVHASLGRVHLRHGTPTVAIVLTAGLTAIGCVLGDAVLVPITEVGSLAIAVGWLAACLSFSARGRGRAPRGDLLMSWLGAAVSLGLVLMKTVPLVPGSFTRTEWIALLCWLLLGAAFWRARPRQAVAAPARLNHYTLLVFAPVLILTGIMGLLGPPAPGGLMSTAVPYDIFHIVFGTLGLALVLLKRPPLVLLFNIGFGLIDLYQAVASYADLFPRHYFQWHRGDDVVHIVIGAALVLIGALGR